MFHFCFSFYFPAFLLLLLLFLCGRHIIILSQYRIVCGLRLPKRLGKKEKKTRLSPADYTRRAMNNRTAVNPPKSRPVGDPVAATADAGNPN